MAAMSRNPEPARAPERTRARILTAAFTEFAAKGFAGARVDAIARRAGSNKRMLYHYFKDKEGLFRAVLRWKISDRMALFHSSSSDFVEGLQVRFAQNCRDHEWIRLLAWESLQSAGGRVHNEPERRRLAAGLRELIRRQQAEGKLQSGVKPEYFQLAMASLAMFPLALPQLARIITGCPPHDPKFQREYGKFLETISPGFRPLKAAAKPKKSR